MSHQMLCIVLSLLWCKYWVSSVKVNVQKWFHWHLHACMQQNEFNKLQLQGLCTSWFLQPTHVATPCMNSNLMQRYGVYGGLETSVLSNSELLSAVNDTFDKSAWFIASSKGCLQDLPDAAVRLVQMHWFLNAQHSIWYSEFQFLAHMHTQLKTQSTAQVVFHHSWEQLHSSHTPQLPPSATM